MKRSEKGSDITERCTVPGANEEAGSDGEQKEGRTGPKDEGRGEEGEEGEKKERRRREEGEEACRPSLGPPSVPLSHGRRECPDPMTAKGSAGVDSGATGLGSAPQMAR